MKPKTSDGKINYLRISLNSSCNLFCQYCCRSAAKENFLSLEEILQVVRVSIPLGINRFRLTGGEPLLRKDCIEIIKKISQTDGIKDLSLTTNGTYLSKYAEDLKDAGLKRLNISLDTLSGKKFFTLTGKDFLDKVISGIKKAKEVGFSPLKINVVMMRKVNLDELLDLVDFFSNLEVQVRFIELMPKNYSDAFFKENFVSAKEVKEILSQNFTLSKASQYGSGPAHYYKINGKGIIGIIAPASKGFCNTCNRLRLTSYGSLKLCLFNKKEIDLRPALSKNDSQALTELFKKAILLKPEKKKESAICGEMIEIGG